MNSDISNHNKSFDGNAVYVLLDEKKVISSHAFHTCKTCVTSGWRENELDWVHFLKLYKESPHKICLKVKPAG